MKLLLFCGPLNWLAELGMRLHELQMRCLFADEPVTIWNLLGIKDYAR